MNKSNRNMALGALLFLPTAGGAVAARRLFKFNDKVIADAQKAGLASLELYEQKMRSIADMPQPAGQTSQLQWFSQIAAAQAKITRELAETYLSAAHRRPDNRRTSRARRRK